MDWYKDPIYEVVRQGLKHFLISRTLQFLNVSAYWKPYSLLIVEVPM